MASASTLSTAAESTPASSAARRTQTLMTPADTDRIPPHLSAAALEISIVSFALGALASVTFLPSLLRLVEWVRTRGDVVLVPKVHSCMQGSTAGWPWGQPQLGVYLGAWAIFHMLEFLITARYNASRLYADSFLLRNGIGYHIAHGAAVLEFLIESYYVPCLKTPSLLTLIGMISMLVGQTARSLAMAHAGNSFSHQVAIQKREDHVLVTTGIYALSRHPSYFGFFYWAVGTQFMLANPLSTLVFIVVLYRFFSSRIRREEVFLVQFFGKAYEDYRRRVPTLLPFV